MRQLIDLDSPVVNYREDLKCPIGLLKFLAGDDRSFDIEFYNESLLFTGSIYKKGFYYDIFEYLEDIKNTQNEVALAQWVDDNGYNCEVYIYNKNNIYTLIYKQKGFYCLYK